MKMKLILNILLLIMGFQVLFAQSTCPPNHFMFDSNTKKIVLGANNVKIFQLQEDGEMIPFDNINNQYVFNRAYIIKSFDDLLQIYVKSIIENKCYQLTNETNDTLIRDAFISKDIDKCGGNWIRTKNEVEITINCQEDKLYFKNDSKNWKAVKRQDSTDYIYPMDILSSSLDNLNYDVLTLSKNNFSSLFNLYPKEITKLANLEIFSMLQPMFEVLPISYIVKYDCIYDHILDDSLIVLSDENIRIAVENYKSNSSYLDFVLSLMSQFKNNIENPDFRFINNINELCKEDGKYSKEDVDILNSAFSIVEDILIDKGTAKAENILISLSEKIKNIDWKKFDKLAEKVAKVTKSAGKKINPILTGILLAYDYYPKFRDFYNDEILYQFQYTKPTISNISTVKCDTCQSDCNIYTIKINGEGFGTNQGVIKIDGDIVPANWSEKLIKVVNWQNKKDNCCICIDVIPCISCDTLKIQHYLLPCCQTGEDLLTINFDYDKFDVSEDDIKKIENFAKKNKGLRDISIFAHTDIYGNNSYNKNLATKRMETVKQLLNKYGIYLSQIKTSEVLGEEMPLLELPEVMPIDEKMHLPNRRVEIYAK